MTRTTLLGVLLSLLVGLPQSLLIAQERRAEALQRVDLPTAAADPDSEIAAAFEQAFGFNPLTEDQLRVIKRREATVRSLSGFSSTVDAGKSAVEDPTNALYQQEFGRRLNALLQSTGGQNILAMLYFVFRESIVEQNEDKRYWLTRLKEMNKISDALADQLKYLQNKARQLEERPKTEQSKEDAGRHEPEKVRADLRVLHAGADDGDKATECDSIPCVTARAQLLTEEQIHAEIATIEADRETVRNRRQMCASQFENANKIASQYINMLSSVLKTMNEMGRGVIRNLR